MSDEKEGNEIADPIKQIKGEMNRKIDKTAQQLETLAQSQAALLAQLDKLSRPAPAVQQEDDMAALMYKDPKAYASKIAQQTRDQIMAELGQQQAMQQRAQSTIGELAQEYPELANSQDPLTKKAVERLGAMPEHERNTAAAMRLAVREAAEELEVKPRSRRPIDDDFSGGSSSGYGAPRARGTKKGLDPDVSAWADVLGLDTSDPDVKQRLIERQNKSWGEPRNLITTRKKGGRK